MIIPLGYHVGQTGGLCDDPLDEHHEVSRESPRTGDHDDLLIGVPPEGPCGIGTGDP